MKKQPPLAGRLLVHASPGRWRSGRNHVSIDMQIRHLDALQKDITAIDKVDMGRTQSIIVQREASAAL